MPSLDGWENLEDYRDYLKVRAWSLALDRRLKVRFDESDLVNETLLRAHASKEPSRDDSPPARMAYLDAIFETVFIDHLREHHAQMRDIDKEEVEVALNESTAAHRFDRADSGASPSEQASRREEYLRAVAAIARLPEKERDLIILTKLQDLSVPEAAERLGIHRGHAARLLNSALIRLREMLKPKAGESS